MTSTLKTILAAAALLAATSTAHASVLSDNLGAFPFDAEPVSTTRWVTASFGTDGPGYELTSVVLLMSLQAGNPGDAEVDIYSSVGAGVGEPGLLIGSLTNPGSFSSSFVTFAASGIVLSPDTTYWVVLKSKAVGSAFEWSWAADSAGSGVGFQHTWGITEDSGVTWSTFDYSPQVMQVNAEPLAPWSDLGFALPGVAGLPHFSGAGTLGVGTSGSLQLTSAAPSAPAFLFLSTSNAPTPFKGGTLVTVPVLLAVPFSTDLAGKAAFAWSSLPSGLSGLVLFLQCAIHDSAAIKGVALSNAVGLDVP